MATTRIEHFYLKNYKKLLLIPLIILAISMVILAFQYSSKGTIINKDVSLKGGLSATISTSQQIDIIDIAPTISYMLNITYPNACTGQPIIELLE